MNKPTPYTWEQYQTEHQVEALWYRLCVEAAAVAAWESGGRPINGLAFNVHSLYGTFFLSYNVAEEGETGVTLQAQGYYPPDWSDEINPAVYAVFEQGWEAQHRLAIEAIMYGLGDEITGDEQAFDDFSRGFLTSCRRVMVRLQDDGVWAQALNLTGDCWYQVTEIDADQDEEERLLEEVRAQMHGGG
ncbi:hypothetical protein L1281_000852 [Neisseria sp. HSC-16F19]|nr:hypothetical protein [Neisseria sp. HSC-16F19]MCP2040270.1 hypothetical protein [Neisseria sp. HSC-16F19]